MLQKEKHILEIGVAEGKHATSMIESLKPKSYTGIDLNFNQLTNESKTILQRSKENGLGINLINEPSSQALANLSKSNYQFDIIYVDANHWHTFVAEELSYVVALLKPKGTLILNDYTDWFVGSMEPCGVKKALDEFLIKNSKKFLTAILCDIRL